MMYSQSERSCWGAAKWTLAAFAAVAVLAYLLGGLDPETGDRKRAGAMQEATADAR
jgi:hypothetical protein